MFLCGGMYKIIPPHLYIFIPPLTVRSAERRVYGYDPLLTMEQVAGFGVEPVDGLKNGMDAVVVTVAHREFGGISLEEIAESMRGRPVVVDVRGVLKREQITVM